MNKRKPYYPRRTVPRLQRQPPERGRGLRWAVLLLPLLVAGLFILIRPRSGETNAATPAVRLTPATVAAPDATPSPFPPPPTSTFFPEPSPSPTIIRTPLPTQLYTTQSGDTLPALAARFGVNPADIRAPQGLQGTTTLVEGQLLIIPRALDPARLGPNAKLIPDSELVFSGTGAGYDPAAFAVEQGGYLAGYKGFADARTRSGGDLLLLAAQHHSINPRLLTALLEYESHWVTDPRPEGDALVYPLGYVHAYRRDLYSQLQWAASQVAIGYYGWRAGTLTEVRFADGSTVRLEPTLNAGTVALQHFLAQTRSRSAWEEAVGPAGFIATYRQLFGDPAARTLDPLLPADLAQPPMRLPFQPGRTWFFSGGPHGAWESGGAQAALDFAPSALEGGCADSTEWVTSVAAGKIVRSEHGSVILDLDGDGREATGWAVLYLHIADQDRVRAGTFVEAGDRIGHPSCTGGVATGTHVHIARKYNGEWIPADGLVPFNLSGWVAQRGKGEYFGSLVRDSQVVEACTCTAAWTAITADR